jgi:hypothetical protein
VIRLSLPLHTVSTLNAREHWSRRAKRAAEQRSVARIVCATHLDWHPGFPVIVTLVRIGPRALDSDNLQGALKAVRDGVADALGVDDGDTMAVRWEYAQERGKAREYGVRVEVERVEAKSA